MTSSDRSDLIAQARAAERVRIADYIMRRARAQKKAGNPFRAAQLRDLARAIRRLREQSR